MAGQTVFSTTDGHRLFSLQFGLGNVEHAAEAALSVLETQIQKAHVRDGLMLDLRLETCVHGRLSAAEPDGFASFLVFNLGPAAQTAGSASPLSQSMHISLEFEREIPQETDVIKVLQTGEAALLSPGVHQDQGGVSWSLQEPTQRVRFGVLIRRNFNDLFLGTFTLRLSGDQSRRFRSPTTSERRDEVEPVLFDPSANPIGEGIDPGDLQTTSNRILLSLRKSEQMYGDTLMRDHSSSKAGNELSQIPSTKQPDSASSVTDGSSTQTGKPTKVKSMMMYHHKQRHIQKPHIEMHGRTLSPSGEIMEMKPLRSEDTDDEVWSDPVRYITSHEMGFNMCGLHITRSGVRCIRSIKMKLVQTRDSGEVEEYESAGHWSMLGMLIHRKQYHDEVKGQVQDRYLVVGRLSTNGYVIKEKIFRYREHDEEQMLRRLRSTLRSVRGTRGMFSLKSISGFGLYQCDPSAGHHTRAILNETQRSCLRTFYNSYNRRPQGAPEYLWDDWTFKHLNNSSKNPIEGKYSIEILLSWSVLRLSIVTSIPVALSLAVGFWYQTLPAEDGSDPTGTAWIIATYIITAGALIIAFLGVATGLEQA